MHDRNRHTLNVPLVKRVLDESVEVSCERAFKRSYNFVADDMTASSDCRLMFDMGVREGFGTVRNYGVGPKSILSNCHYYRMIVAAAVNLRGPPRAR